jgi:hypothetical protein
VFYTRTYHCRTNINRPCVLYIYLDSADSPLYKQYSVSKMSYLCYSEFRLRSLKKSLIPGLIDRAPVIHCRANLSMVQINSVTCAQSISVRSILLFSHLRPRRPNILFPSDNPGNRLYALESLHYGACPVHPKFLDKSFLKFFVKRTDCNALIRNMFHRIR